MAAAAGQTITGFGIFSSAIVLAVMILPTITTPLHRRAGRGAQSSIARAAYALGCTRWQTVWNVVLR